MHKGKLFQIYMNDKIYGISFNLFQFSFNMLGYELVDILSLHNSAGWEKLHPLLCKWWNDLEEALRHSTIPIVIVLGMTEPGFPVFAIQ